MATNSNATAAPSTAATSSERLVRDWHISRFLQNPEDEAFGLIILNGRRLEGTTALKKLWQSATYKVAADGGANELCRHHKEHQEIPFPYVLDAIVGDLDSLTPTARDFFSTLDPPTKLVHDPDQYSTDLDKSIRWIRSHSPNMSIAILGGLEGRLDQGISQLYHMFKHQGDTGDVYLLSTHSMSFVMKAGRHRVLVRDGVTDPRESQAETEVFGKHVGVLPLKEPSRLTLKGFEWDVSDWPTDMGGIISTSNHVLPTTEVLEVETTADVVFTIALKQEF